VGTCQYVRQSWASLVTHTSSVIESYTKFAVGEHNLVALVESCTKGAAGEYSRVEVPWVQMTSFPESQMTICKITINIIFQL